IRRPAAGNASPRKSRSTPAMMRSNVDLPAPLAPSTPIFAPWKNESQMPRRISRLGGMTFRRSFMTNAYSPAISLSESLGIEATVLGHHAAILDHAYPGARELLGGLVVPDAELKPDRLRSPRQGENLVGVAGQIFGAAEDLDHVGRLGEVAEGRHGLRVVQAAAGEPRVDRSDPVAARMQIRRYVVRGLRRVSLGAEHRHGLGFSEDRREAVIIVDEQDTPVAHRSFTFSRSGERGNDL